MKEAPGSRWVYSGASSMLLVGVLESAAGGSTLDFARQHLFEPLGITRFHGRQTPAARLVGQGSLSLTARDFLKLGQVHLAGGTWKGKRIVSESWVRLATRTYVDLAEYDEPQYAGYAFHWWRGSYVMDDRTVDTFFASGNGGNKIQVVPDLDLVVVLQGTAYDQLYSDTRSHGLFLQVLKAVDPD